MGDGNDDFPAELAPSAAQPGVSYERVAGLHATATREGSEPALRDGDPPSGAWPVYRSKSDGQLAVATGRIFARFADGERAADRADAFRRAGYEIEKMLPWAENAIWLHAPEAGVAAALAGVPRLAALPGAVSVEPELLRQRAKK